MWENSNVAISQDISNPLTSAITSTLRLDVNCSQTGVGSIANSGYLGFGIDGSYFTTSFWIKGEYDGEIAIRLKGRTSGIEYGWAIITVHSVADRFTQFEQGFSTAVAPDPDNVWTFNFDSEKAVNGYLNIGLPQLFPSTFKDR